MAAEARLTVDQLMNSTEGEEGTREIMRGKKMERRSLVGIH